jgi:hypothetical protein
LRFISVTLAFHTSRAEERVEPLARYIVSAAKDVRLVTITCDEMSKPCAMLEACSASNPGGLVSVGEPPADARR